MPQLLEPQRGGIYVVFAGIERLLYCCQYAGMRFEVIVVLAHPHQILVVAQVVEKPIPHLMSERHDVSLFLDSYTRSSKIQMNCILISKNCTHITKAATAKIGRA